MKKIYRTTAVLAILLLSVAQATPLTERVAYWQQRLNKEVPIGSSRQSVLEWASRNKLRVSDKRAERPINVRLENMTLEVHQRQQATSSSDGLCEQYRISGVFMLDGKGQVESVVILPLGDCR
jgi:hypothetical protein